MLQGLHDGGLVLENLLGMVRHSFFCDDFQGRFLICLTILDH